MDTENSSDPLLSELLANNICSYFSPEQFTDFYKSNNLSKFFTAFHFNSRSLPSHISQYQVLVDSLNCHLDVLSFSETWFTLANANLYKTSFPGYNLFHACRETRGGGVAAFIRDCYLVTEISILETFNTFEYLILKIANPCSKVNILLVVMYRPPNTALNLFLDDFAQFVDYLEPHIKKNAILIAGDFNIDLLNQHDKNTYQFLNNMYTSNLVPFINIPTRFTDHSATLIDNFFTNNRKIVCSAVLQSDITDHLPIFIATDINVCRKSSTTKYSPVFTYSINKKNISSLNNALNHVDWSSVDNSLNPNCAYDNFLSILQNKIDINLTFANQANDAQTKQPWMTTLLLIIINHANGKMSSFVNTFLIKSLSKLTSRTKIH